MQRAIVMQRKTHRPVQFEVTDITRQALLAWIDHAKLSSNAFLFPSRVAESPHLSTRQYARIVRRWVASIGLDVVAYGTHDAPNESDADLSKNQESSCGSAASGT